MANPYSARMPLFLGEFWRESSGVGRATAVVALFLLSWHLLRLFSSRRCQVVSGAFSKGVSSARISKLISNSDLRDLMISLGGKLKGNDRWEDLIEKSGDLVSYKAKFCRPQDGPPKYLSVATFEKCSTELLRDFYMDNQYRKKWDKISIHHELLQVDENSGTEIGRSIKKFPLLTPREYILAWRVWEGKDKTFYCFIRDCEHPMAIRREKYVRVGFFRSGWRIRKVPGRDACEITMVHQENAGINLEIVKLAFAKGVWSYVSKMNKALREYTSCSPIHLTSVHTLHRLIKKVPPELEINAETSIQEGAETPGSVFGRRGKKPSRCLKKWISNGVLLLGGMVCLSRGRSSIGAHLAMACILKKLMKRGTNIKPSPDYQTYTSTST